MSGAYLGVCGLHDQQMRLAMERCCKATANDSVHDQLLRRHRSEQYFTLSQSRAHFFRHANGFWHATQIFCGRLDLSCLSPVGVFRDPRAISSKEPCFQSMRSLALGRVRVEKGSGREVEA